MLDSFAPTASAPQSESLLQFTSRLLQQKHGRSGVPHAGTSPCWHPQRLWMRLNWLQSELELQGCVMLEQQKQSTPGVHPRSWGGTHSSLLEHFLPTVKGEPPTAHVLRLDGSVEEVQVEESAGELGSVDVHENRGPLAACGVVQEALAARRVAGCVR
eukprot:711943-Hanusia_phi.AAC.4